MRFLFYSHDGLGLGHTRRHLAIAKALTQQAAVDIAVAQLKGLLDTPSADLVQARADLEVAQQQLAALTTPPGGDNSIE